MAPPRKRGRPIKRVTRKPRVQDQEPTAALEDDAASEDDFGPVHLSRDQEYPSEEPIHDDDDGDWEPPGLLQAPPAREGYTQRWIRVRRGSAEDWANYNARFREGWRPRPPSTVPKNFGAPTEAHGRFGEAIIVEGMMLCEMSLRRSAQRKAYYKRRLDTATEAIDRELLKVQQPGHPISRQANTAVTVGKRRPNVQEDDDAA